MSADVTEGGPVKLDTKNRDMTAGAIACFVIEQMRGRETNEISFHMNQNLYDILCEEILFLVDKYFPDILELHRGVQLTINSQGLSIVEIEKEKGYFWSKTIPETERLRRVIGSDTNYVIGFVPAYFNGQDSRQIYLKFHYGDGLVTFTMKRHRQEGLVRANISYSNLPPQVA